MGHTSHTWNSGDVIPANLLNSIENDLAAAAVIADVGTAGTATGDALRAAYGPRLPSYVPATVQNQFDASRSVYNRKSSNTRLLRASIGRARAGAGLAHHAFIGDSQTSGYTGATFERTLSWPFIYRDTFATAGVPSGGTGVVVATDAATFVDPRWSFTGSWTNGSQYLFNGTVGTTATFSTTGTGEKGRYFRLTTLSGYTGYSYSVDGGAVTGTITPPGSGNVVNLTIDCGTVATHSIVLTTTGTSSVILAGNLYGTSGLLAHNLGRFGSTASGSGDGSWTDLSNSINVNPARVGAMAGIAPDVVWCALGVNEIGSVSAATVTAALTTLRNQFASSDFILVGQYQPQSTSAAVWTAYLAALYGLADTLDVPLLDLYDRAGGYTVANANGLMAADGVHLKSQGLADWGLAAFALATA